MVIDSGFICFGRLRLQYISPILITHIPSGFILKNGWDILYDWRSRLLLNFGYFAFFLKKFLKAVSRSFSLLVYAGLDELFSHGFSFLWLVRSFAVSINE